MAANRGHENWQTLTQRLRNGSPQSVCHKHPRLRLHSFGKVRHPTIKTVWITRNETEELFMNTNANRRQERLSNSHKLTQTQSQTAETTALTL